jgi:peptidoglycan hydrolase CwlO-like protein
MYKDYITPVDHENLKDELNSFDSSIRQLKGEKQHLVKMFDTLSKERDQATADCDKLKSEKSDM